MKLEDVAWAREPDPDSAPHAGRVDRPRLPRRRRGSLRAGRDGSRRAPRGSLRRVTLFQEPVVEGALLSLRGRQRRDPRAGRRLGLRAQPVRPHDAGAPPAGLRVQADHLRRGAREGLHRVFDPLRSPGGLRRRVVGLRLATAELRQELLRTDHDARGARALGEQRDGPSVSRRRRRLRDLLRAQARDPVAAAARPLARARLERAVAARADARLRRVRRARAQPVVPSFIRRVSDAQRQGAAREGRAGGRAAAGRAGAGRRDGRARRAAAPVDVVAAGERAARAPRRAHARGGLPRDRSADAR